MASVYGVPLCKRICELHKFKYRIESKYLEYTTVIIQIGGFENEK